MLLLAFRALGVARLDASRNYVKTGGGIFGDACTGDGIQKYKYNGKELDRTHGLDTYDYGARMYDAALPVWDRPDPLAHKYYHVSPYAYCGNDPIIFFDSKGEEPTNYEAALMAKHVYGDNVELFGGWHKSNIQYKSFVNCRNGLKSALYEKTSEEGITEYAYVTSGTEKRDIEDYKEDVLQLFGESSQYRESVQNARVLSRVFPNSEITFVGHSLGGGLAAANALATDRNAITFNPAAITRETKKKLELPASTTNGCIFNVVVKGEIVSFIQSKIGLKPDGSTFYLNALYLPWNSIINTKMRLDNHSIDVVLKKLEEEMK